MTNVEQSNLLISKKEEYPINVHTDKTGIFLKSQICSLQLAVSVGVNLGSLGQGAASTWPSPALPFLKSSKSKLRITDDQGSWIASLYNIGAIIGLLLFPLLVDRIGRKYTLFIFFLPQIFSWILIYSAKTVEVLYAARILSGIGYTAGMAVQLIYLGEIAEKRIRGSLVIISKLMYSIGAIICATAGTFFSYENMNLTLLLISLTFGSTFTFMPESPYFYLTQGRDKDAAKSWSKLRGIEDSDTVKKEINKIKEDVVKSQPNKRFVIRKLFESKCRRKAFFIVLIANASVVFSGFITIGAYNEEIFKYSGSFIEPKHASMVFMCMASISIIIICPAADYFGRRLITLYSGIIGALSLGTLGVFFFFKYHPEIADVSSFLWVPLVSLTVFKATFFAGVFSTSIIFISELFSVEVKSSSVSLLNILKDLSTFFVTFGFYRFIQTFGIYSLFWTFATFCFVLPLINFIIMPETKGKTLEEIQQLLG